MTLCKHGDCFEIILDVCDKLQQICPERFRVVEKEQDETNESCEDAHLFLKLDGKRHGRDFKLYGFMSKLEGVGAALADFAEVLTVVKCKTPEVFESVLEIVISWDQFFDVDMREGWRKLWD